MSQPILTAPWSPDTNYPAGANPWNGHPTKTTPAYVWFQPSPSFAPSAQELNAMFNVRDLQQSTLLTFVNASAVANWNPWTGNPTKLLSGNTDILVTACWDPWFSQWIVAALQGTVPELIGSGDGGRSWDFPFGARQCYSIASYPTIAMAVSSTTGTLCSLSSNGSAVENAQSTVTGTLASSPVGFMSGITAGAMLESSGDFMFIGCKIASGAYSVGNFAVSANDGASWQNDSFDLPATWVSGASTIRSVIAARGTIAAGNAFVWALCGNTAGTDVSRLLGYLPSSFIDITPTLTTNRNITGLAFSATDGLWGLLLADASNSYLITSPDLSTWTQVHTFNGATAQGLACVGSVWAVCLQNTRLGDPGNRIVYSANVAALGASCTWSCADYADYTPLSGLTSAGQFGLLFSNGNQLLRLQAGGGGPVTTAGIAGGSVAISHVAGMLDAAAGI